MYGPTIPISEETHAGKYRGEGESFKEAMNRVASALTKDPESYRAFRDTLLFMRFMPAGRVQNAMGSTKTVTPYNCYVSGTIEDSYTRGEGSIMNRASQAAETMRMGGGIGYDFSPLRPWGDMIRKLGSQASGPCSFMPIYNAIGIATSSSGHRRGAQMGVLDVGHPDIERFIHMKQNDSSMAGFNVSIAITDLFMKCLEEGKPFPLVFERRTYREIDPRALWEMIMRSTWDWAEPGVLFIDRINHMNNLWYCETIRATNPCGEQPLPPFGACLLGSFNLVKYLQPTETGGYAFDFHQLRADIPHVVRAMDNVVDEATYPLYEQEKEAKSKRRMGLGVTGVANAIEAMGFPYGSEGFVNVLREILTVIRDETYRASAKLAKEKGAFPLFDREKYLDGNFTKTLPADVRDMIAEHGIRNSHLTSIAPTGTISLCADNVSSGIEPVFLHRYERTVQTFKGPKKEKIEDYGVRELGVEGKTTDDVTVSEHLAVLATTQALVDSAVSKTVNVPSDCPWDDFGGIYRDAYRMGAKGITTYQKNGKRGAVLEEIKDEGEAVEPEVDEGSTCYIDPISGRRECE